MEEFEKHYERLKSWSKSLARSVDTYYDQIKNALNPSTVLPPNCPSHASMAELIFGQIKSKFDEVEGAIEDIEKEILKIGKEK